MSGTDNCNGTSTRYRGTTLPDNRATPAPAFNPMDPRSSSEFVQRLPQRAGDETLPERATGCDEPDPARAQTKPPKSRPVADLGGVVRPDATSGTSSGGGTRTPDTRIMIPHATPLTLEENADVCGCAAPDAAPKNGNAPIDPELAQVIEVWDTLPPAIREAILAMLRAAE